MSVKVTTVDNSKRPDLPNESRQQNAVNKRALASAFVNMDDSQLMQLANISARESKIQRKRNEFLSPNLLAFPIVAAASDGILEAGSLSAKSIKATKTLGTWGFILIMLGIYDAFKNAAVENSPKMQKFQQNNPLTSIVADIGAFIGISSLGLMSANKIAGKIAKETPQNVKFIKKNIKKLIGKIDKSSLNKTVLPAIESGIEKLTKNAPLAKKAGVLLIASAPWILLLKNLVSEPKPTKADKREVKHNFHQLKRIQFNTAKQLLTLTEVERDVLAMDARYTDEIRDELDKTLG